MTFVAFSSFRYLDGRLLSKVMKMMVGDNLTDEQLQQLVDRQIRNADKDYDGSALSLAPQQTTEPDLHIFPVVSRVPP